MSGRRPGDAAPAGQPNPKRPKTDAPSSSGAFDIAAIRAQLAAKKAALEARMSPSTSAAATPPPSGPPAPAGPAALPPPATMNQSVAERLAAAKARVEAMNARMSNPYLSGSGSMPVKVEHVPSQSTSSVALHPLLMTEQQQKAAGEAERNEKKRERDRYKPMAPKFSTVRANQGDAKKSSAGAAAVTDLGGVPVLNPYAAGIEAARGSASPAPGEDVAAAAGRRSRKLKMAQPGKYVQQGEELRKAIKFEELKARIAERSRKAGLEDEFGTQQTLKKSMPPEVEWWDKAILPGDDGSYGELEKAVEWISTSDDSLVTHLVQHPIPIPAPGDKKQTERGLMLTKKEQKKMRRQRRRAELEDKRDRQKMGLLPPDPPKVRLANLMKVLTTDAVQDPTKIEAKVKREVAHRAMKHEKDNEERKLTPEERKQKEYEQMVKREGRGIYAAAYKIKYLTNGRHKFKVRETAKKDSLSGVCIFHPDFALVLVEGSDKEMKHYRNLLERRIDWTEQARPLAEDGEDNNTSDKEAGATGGGDDAEGPDSLADNRCEMIWEGEVPDRAHKFFKARHAESDKSAKDWLGERYEAYWDLAKRWQWKGDEF